MKRVDKKMDAIKRGGSWSGRTAIALTTIRELLARAVTITASAISLSVAHTLIFTPVII